MSDLGRIEVEDLVIRYGAVAAVGPVSFTVEPGEQLTLLGPSGCGKTTTLRAIAGLETPSGGSIRIGGQEVFSGARGVNVPVERRELSMVFQSYAIWPHMTVFENVAYGLRVRRRPAAEIREKVGEALALVQMGAYADRPASQLSGGQQQRVALARACAFSPRVVLFDEPLSNLDAKLRGDMRIELRELQHRLGLTAVYVTHDLEEALAMSDRIVVMREGRIEQNGSPNEIYHTPRTEFVADFIGSSNLIRGRLRSDLARDEMVALETPWGAIVHANPCGRSVPPSPCVSVRTVHLQLSAASTIEAVNSWPVRIVHAVFLGDLTQIHVAWGDRELVIRQTAPPPCSKGETATLSVDPRHCILLEDDMSAPLLLLKGIPFKVFE